MLEPLWTTHLAIALVLACASAAISWAMLRAGPRIGLVAVPNSRSSHDRPTPSAGGVSIAAAFLAGLAVAAVLGGGSGPQLAVLAAAAAGLAAVGLVDDLGRLDGIRIKVAAQLAAAAALVAADIVWTRLWLPGIGMVELGWAGAAVTIVWLVAMTNIVNFMDGLDGLAAGTIVLAGCFLCAATALQGASVAWIPAYALAAGAAGFLPFNFPRARMFMGDVGSQLAGFAFAALAVWATRLDAAPSAFLVVPLLFLHFIFDAAFTLCRRALRGEDVTAAHRGHLYQLANRLGLSHARVAAIHFGMAAAQGAAALHVAAAEPADALLVLPPLLLAQALYATAVVRAARRRGLL